VPEALDRFALHVRDPVKRKAIVLALKLGIYFLLRKSEYLPGNKSKGKDQSRGRQWSRIKFFDVAGKPITWPDIRVGRSYEVVIDIDRSKTDQFGRGRLVRHKRVSGENCIVKELEIWATECRDQHNAKASDYLFQVGERVFVKDSDIAQAMRKTVEHLGWDSSKISAHSLRYGGATMLAAAGLPQYVIAYFGGWTADSKALKRYMQLGAEAVAQASHIMAAGFDKSLAESRTRVASL
jgi:hypothetical protein